MLFQFICENPLSSYHLFSSRMLRILLKKRLWSYFLLLCILVFRGGYKFMSCLFLCNTLIWKIHVDVSENRNTYFPLKSGERQASWYCTCCIAPYIGMVMVMMTWWSNFWQEKSKCLQRLVPQSQIFAIRHTWHMSYCGFELKPSLLSIIGSCYCSASDWRKIQVVILGNVSLNFRDGY
jgi:hypothetical protein